MKKKFVKFLAAAIFFIIGMLGLVFFAVLLFDPSAAQGAHSGSIGRIATILSQAGVPLHWTYIAFSVVIGVISTAASVIFAIELFKPAADTQSARNRPPI